MSLIDHIGVQSSTIVTAILAALAPFRLASGSGTVRTIKRYAGDEFSPELIDQQLTSGSPAWLVASTLGSWSVDGTSGRRYRQTLGFAIVCAAASQESVAHRLAGDSGIDLLTSTVTLGVEDLLDAGTYYALRAMESSSIAITNPRPVAHRWLRVEPGKYLAVAELACERRSNSWDDAPTDLLESLGIVHSPTDSGDLWEEDNETPKSEWPTTVDGGVTDL